MLSDRRAHAAALTSPALRSLNLSRFFFFFFLSGKPSVCIRRPLESAERRRNGLLFWRPLENTRPRLGRAGVGRFGRSSAVDTFEKELVVCCGV